MNINTLTFNVHKNSQIEMQNGSPINATNLEFNATFMQNGQQGHLSIIYSWWNTTFVVHPYGTTSNSVTVNTNQSKYSFVISGWKFGSLQNRLALEATIHTTVGLSSYNILFYKNNTISMFTKTNPDGKGFRGGIIYNPDQAFSDNQLSQVNVSINQNGLNLFMEYAFPAFNNFMDYDPTYSAVSSISAPSAGTDASTIGSPIPGFTYAPILVGLFMIGTVTMIRKVYSRRNKL